MENKKIEQKIKGDNNSQTYIETQINYYLNSLDDEESKKNENKVSEDSIVSSFIIKKSLLEEFKATKDSLLFLTLGGKNPSDENGLIDTGFVSFLKVLLCEEKFDSAKFSDTKTLIISKHDKEIVEIIKARLNVVANYWQGKDIKDELKNLLDNIKDNKKIPTWIINDVAIDLRNFSCPFTYNYGQRILDESLENVYFPIIDRLSNNIKDNIIKFYRELSLENPYARSKTTLVYIFNDLASYYCTALLYGSITHLLIVRSLLQDLLYSLFINQKNISLFEQIVKFDILRHDDKHLEGLIRKNKSIWFNFIDYKKIISSIDFLQDEESKNLARLELINYFGLLLSDKDFYQLCDWLFDFSQSFLDEKVNFMKYKEPIKKAFNTSCIRMQNNSIFHLLCNLLGSHKFVFVKIGCDIFDCIRIRELDANQQNKLKELIVSLMSNESFTNNIHSKESVLITFCKNVTINYDDLTDLVKTRFESFYNTIFKLELLDKDNVSFLLHIDRYLDEINSRIQEKKKGVVFGYASNPYEVIKTIIHIEQLNLESDYIDKILNTLYPVLLSENQMIYDKCDCLSLITYLFARFPAKYIWDKCFDYLKINEDKIANYFEADLFDNSSKSQLFFYYESLIGLITHDDKLLFQNWMKVFSMKDFDKIRCVKLISTILDTSLVVFSDKNIQSILQLASNMSQDNERDICYYSTQILCSLVDSNYQDIVLEQMSQLMEYANMYSKRLIVDHFLTHDKIKSFSHMNMRINNHKITSLSYFIIS